MNKSMPWYASGLLSFTLNEPKYGIPYPSLSDYQIKIEMNDSFHRFRGIIFSHGQVVHENETLIEVSSSTMNGSPIVS